MPTIEFLPDYTHADTTVEKVEREPQIDDGTIAAFDFLEPYTYGDSVLPASSGASASLNNLVDGGASGLTGTTDLPIGSTGVTMTGKITESMSLPAAVKLSAGATHFGFGGFIKHADNSGALGANVFVAANNVTNTSAANVQWLIQSQRGTNNYFAQVGPAFSGSIALAIGEVAHLFFEAIVTAGNIVLKWYKNGVLLGTSGSVALSGGVLPTPASAPALGENPGGSAFCGQIGSFDFEDFSAPGARSVADFLSRAYGQSAGRFS